MSFIQNRIIARRGRDVAATGKWKRDQAFRIGIMLGDTDDQLKAFIIGFRRKFK